MDAYRIRDITVASLGLSLLLPLFIVVAAAIKLDSPGPVLFLQERVGRNGSSFKIHKFRSMTTAGGLSISTANDPRITRVGRIIRWTKIDELPQLFDVLTGNMSLVGPRPEVPEFVDHWPPAAKRLILSVRPGITDPASIQYRDESGLLASSRNPRQTYIEEILPKKVEHYLDYVQNRSFLGDARLILATFKAITSPGN